MHEKRRKDARLNGQLDRPWLGHQPNLHWLLIFKFESWIFEKISKFWAASYKNEFNLLLVRVTVCIESFLPIGWRTFIRWKNPPSAAVFWFGLRDVGNLQIFYSPAVLQRTIVYYLAFLEPGLAKKIAVCALTTVCRRNRRNGFLYEDAQNLIRSIFKYSRLKLKNLKRGWCPIYNGTRLMSYL